MRYRPITKNKEFCRAYARGKAFVHPKLVLYVNKNSLDKIKQSYAGYLNTTVPEGGWGAYWEKVDAQAVYDWTFPNTARKYEIGGTSNYAGAIALGESLGLVNEIGIENIQQRVWEIGEYCMDRWCSLRR